MEENTVQTVKRSFVGIVTSDKMDKSIVVTITTKKMDRLYKKYVTRSKKYMAHDEQNDAHIGDTVQLAAIVLGDGVVEGGLPLLLCQPTVLQLLCCLLVQGLCLCQLQFPLVQLLLPQVQGFQSLLEPGVV